MKNLILLFVASFALLLSACCKHPEASDPTPSECITAKIEAFKQTPDAQSIIKINRPYGTLYWFVDFSADGGEAVLDENCELVCTTDCECDGSLIKLCDGSHLDFPLEIIWEK